MKKGGYGLVYQEVMRNGNLSAEAKAIYAYLSSIAGVGGTCYPSLPTMQKDLGMSRNRISKHMNQLLCLGVVEKTRERTKTGFGPNVYRVTHEIKVSEEMKNMFQAIENGNNIVIIEDVALQNEALQGEELHNKALQNLATNNNNINNNNNKDVCTDPSGILLSLVDKTEYDVPLSKIDKWKTAYPAVDITQELHKMAAWLDSNPQRRKTRRGIDRFINSWLSREQDKGRVYNSSDRQQSEPISYDLPPEYQEMYKNLGKTPPKPDDPFQ